MARDLRFLLRACLLALVACAGSAHAQAWPAKPIKLIVPYPPGGSADILARAIGQKLSEGLGQSVVIDNRPGAGTAIGAEATAKAAPDGYTIMLGTVSSHAINPALTPGLKYDPVKDFAPVSLVASIPFVLLVHPSLPARSVQELIALAKAKPGSLNFSSAGSGTSNHLAGELFKSMTHTFMVHIPYRGSAPALTDLLAGQVQLMFDLVLTAQPHVKSGAARALAVTSLTRSAALPNVPTVAESGVPGYEVSAWFGLFAPAGTPAGVVAALNAETVKAMRAPDLRERLASQGADAASSTPEEFAAYVKDELGKWTRVIKASGMKAD
ncbi:MAG: tripartite tricarboxylate transporter substrate binding protein [Proteobacteria bacterium]|nr:tripartite tricarboxylate transporter substrate binding protein [Pseudomonadota bacterium]